MDQGAESIRNIKSTAIGPWKIGILLLLISAVPIFAVEYLPLHDYPNHLSRVTIIAHWKTMVHQHQNYVLGNFLLPNIGSDLVMLALGTMFPMDIAGKITIYFSLVMCCVGAIWINGKINKNTALIAVLLVFVLYNGILIWGFINYIFGIGLMLIGFSCFISIKNLYARLSVGCVFSILILFSHLVAFGIYALCVFGYVLNQLWEKKTTLRNAVLSGLQFIVPVVLFFMTRTPSSGVFDFRYVNNPMEKLEFLLRFFITFMPLADALLLAAGALVLILLLTKTIALTLDRAMAAPVAMCVLAFLLLPFSFFGSYFLDARIPLALAFVGLAAIRVRVNKVSFYRCGMVGLATLALLRVGVIAHEWRSFDARYRALDLASIGPGAALFTAAGPRDGLMDQLRSWRPPMTFAASYASITGTFVPSMFADPRHQPLFVAPAVAALYQFQDTLPRPVADQADLRALAERIRALSHFPRTYILVLRCDRLALRDDPVLDIVLRSGPECLVRLR